MKPCTGCRHLVRMYSGLGLCRWPERNEITWGLLDDPYTGRTRTIYFRKADGSPGSGAYWRPTVEKERGDPERCGPDAVHYEPNWRLRLWARLTGRTAPYGA